MFQNRRSAKMAMEIMMPTPLSEMKSFPSSPVEYLYDDVDYLSRWSVEEIDAIQTIMAEEPDKGRQPMIAI